MDRHADVPLWVQVGDVASNDGEYFTPLRPLYWIKGNNEDFDVIAEALDGRPPSPTLHYLRNGGPHLVGPWTVAALGGTFAPSWYHTPASALPPSRGRWVAGASVKLGKSRDDKRRHFVRDEVTACKTLTNRRLPHPRSAAAVPPRRPAHRRGEDRHQRSAHFDVSPAAPLRPSPRIHRFGATGCSVHRPRCRHQVIPAHRRRVLQV